MAGSADGNRRGARKDVAGFPSTMFLCVFIVGYVLLYALYSAIPDDVLRDVVFHWGITVPAALTIRLADAQSGIQAAASTLHSARASLEVVRGCDGSGVLFLLLAAMLASPVSWSRKALGALLAVVTIYGINQARLIALYFVRVYQTEWFEPLHTYVFPMLFVALGAAVFMAWAGYRSARPHPLLEA